MLNRFFCLLLSCLILVSCSKETDQLVKPVLSSKDNLSFKSPDNIPSDILTLMYKELIRDGHQVSADRLKSEYDFQTGKRINTTNARTETDSYVPGVGTVLGGGTWQEYANNTWAVNYGKTRASLDNIGWTSLPFNNMTSSTAYDNTIPSVGSYLGTTGQSRFMEAIFLPYLRYVNEYGYTTGAIRLKYQAHIHNIGWQSVVGSDQMAGTYGQRLDIQGLILNVDPTTKNVTFNDGLQNLFQVKVYCRAHLTQFGWQNWVGEGQLSGTVGQNRSMEAFQIRAYIVKTQ
jgi:hypothetical protein